MAAFIHPKYENSFQRACDIINYFENQLKKYLSELFQVKTRMDIEKVIQDNKIGYLLTIENGRAIEDKLENIDYFYNKGVRVMSINWNEDNLLGCGALTKNDIGLTKFGEQYVKKLNGKGIIVDISHSSEKTFWNAIKISERPLVATHSCCYSLCQHPRNLKDDQIKAIAKNGGLVGICYCSKFLSNGETATAKDVANHISYIANLVGIDYVGLGSDFDGLDEDEMVSDLKNIADIGNLIKALKDIGFHENEIEKIMGQNWIRVLREQL